jgi:hypothetical protein
MRDGSAEIHPCRCQYAAADLTASRETFHVDGARSAHRAVNRSANRSGSTARGPGAGAELGYDPAQDPPVGAAGAGLLGAAQGGQVGVGGLTESDVTGGRGEAADRSHGRTLSEVTVIPGVPGIVPRDRSRSDPEPGETW